MELRCGMRTTKCQLLVTSLCVMLLGLSIATLSTVTHYGLRFTLISNVSLDSNAYKVIHHTAFYFGICLSMTLILAALLSSAATVRESQCLTAMGGADLRKAAWPCSCHLAHRGFFCFALAFCGLIPAACWRYTHSTEVEDSMMDVYDFVYEEVRRNTSSFRRHELTAIHEAFLCCGKHSPFGDTTDVQSETCPPDQVHDEGQDCLREIQDFLKKHMDFVFSLLGITIGLTVYGMFLTSFLWFSIHFSSNLYRKGKYILRER
ncbi:tetraspanin-32 isoform X1 [Serinus canaria]|uniref:tetraspanin-32 isoform X1 n=1 Tax=Serinus canaria TaxID=9135 RepID=UPI0021CD0DB7|nr:tetraspanin-32 isoform X1 [Serinus canaria]